MTTAQTQAPATSTPPLTMTAAFEGIEVKTPSTTVRMALGNGHQGISDTAFGTYKFDKTENKPTLVDIVRYDAECVNPPHDVDSIAWLEGGMKGAKCE